MNRCTLFMRLTGAPESFLHLTDNQAHAPLQISSELYACLLLLPSHSHKPAYSSCRWDLTGHSSNVPSILLKKQLCAPCSLKCKAYFIPCEPNSLQSLVALLVCCRWKMELHRLGLVCFAIWLWSRYSLQSGVDEFLTWLRMETCTQTHTGQHWLWFGHWFKVGIF